MWSRVLVDASNVQLAVAMKTAPRFLRLNGNINAFRPTECSAIRVRIVPEEVLTTIETIIFLTVTRTFVGVIAIWTLRADAHTHDVFQRHQNNCPKAVDARPKPSRARIARRSS